MSVTTGSLKAAAENVKGSVQSLDGTLRSEVFGGKWNDDVGHSYLAYTETLRRIAENAVSAADSLDGIQRSLDAMDERADRAKLEKLKSAVKNA